MGSACSQPQQGGVQSPSINNSNNTSNSANGSEKLEQQGAAGNTAAVGGPATITTPATKGVHSSIDKTLANMTGGNATAASAQNDVGNKATNTSNAPSSRVGAGGPSNDASSKRIGGGGPDAPPGSDGAAITSDEQERINTLMTSPMLHAITPEMIKIIRETWGLSMKRSDFAVAFYNDLLTKHRSATEAIFYGVDIVLQAGRLVKMIEGAINLLDSHSSLVPVIIRLGSRHVAYGTTSQHFVLVTNSLTDLILETVGPEIVTPEVISHWRLVLGTFQQIMEAGYGTAGGKAVGRKHHGRIQRTLLKCWKSSVAGHLKQLKQAGGCAPLPDLGIVMNAAATNMRARLEHQPRSTAMTGTGGVGSQTASSSSTPHTVMNYSHLFFGVPLTITEAMIGAAMQKFIVNGGDRAAAAVPPSSFSAGGTFPSSFQQQSTTSNGNFLGGGDPFSSVQATKVVSEHLSHVNREVSIDVNKSPVMGNTRNVASNPSAASFSAAAAATNAHGGPMIPIGAPSNPQSPTTNTNANVQNVQQQTASGGTNGTIAAIDFNNTGGVGVPMNHLLAPPVSSSALSALMKLPPREFDNLITDAFELGLSHVEEDKQYFDLYRRWMAFQQNSLQLSSGAVGGSMQADSLTENYNSTNINQSGSEAKNNTNKDWDMLMNLNPETAFPPTIQQSEMLYNRMQMTGRLLISPQFGLRQGDLESFNESFVKSALFFASPEWNNPFVRDQMARFWMKFCSFMAIVD